MDASHDKGSQPFLDRLADDLFSLPAELRKVASLGLPQLLRFMELSFGVRMPSLEPDERAGPNLARTSPKPRPNLARTSPEPRPNLVLALVLTTP